MTEIEFYQTNRGDKPVEKYISNIKNRKEIPHIIKILKKIEKYGCYKTKIETKNIERLNKDIDQIKYHRHRIPFCKAIKKIFLVSAFYKKTNKTPKKELKKAVKRYKQLIREGKIK